jgi:hypothetical protein
MILKTIVHRVLDAYENDDEMSCFGSYFRDEGHENEKSIYSISRLLTDSHLPKFSANIPHL